MSNHNDVVKNIINKTNEQKEKNPRIYRLTWASGQNNVVSLKEAIETINRWANQTGWEWIRIVNTETKKQQIVYESSNHIGKKLNTLNEDMFIEEKVQTVKELLKQYNVDYDDKKQLDRKINFAGAGWYSMDDNQVYQFGKKPTYSRIKVTKK